MNKQKIIAVTAASFALLSIATLGLHSVRLTQVHAEVPGEPVEQRLAKKLDVNKTDFGSGVDMKESYKPSAHKEDISDDMHEESDGNSIDREFTSLK